MTQVTIEAKPWWQSKVIWLNAVTLLLVLADWATTQQFSFVNTELFVGVVSGLNVVLRLTGTNRPVSTSKGQDVEISRHA